MVRAMDKLTAQEMDAMYRLDHWRSKVSGSSPAVRFVDIHRDLAEYLISDGVSGSRVAREQGVHQLDSSDSDSHNDDAEDAEDTDDGEEFPAAPVFEEFESAVGQAIRELGGKVCPKVSVVCPEDASWITFDRTTKCVDLDDLMALLKSSDRVADVLDQLLLSCDSEPNAVVTTLSLRKWSNFESGMEFRCFLDQGYLLGISQRRTECHLAVLEDSMDEVGCAISEFVHRVLVTDEIQASFGCSLTADVFVDKQMCVWIIDLGPLGPPSDPLLFEWHEMSRLLSMQREQPHGAPEFRRVDRDSCLRPSKSLYSGVPFDLQGQAGCRAVAEAAEQLESSGVGDEE